MTPTRRLRSSLTLTKVCAHEYSSFVSEIRRWRSRARRQEICLFFLSPDLVSARIDPECEEGDERINADGIVRLFEDLNVDPEDVRR